MIDHHQCHSIQSKWQIHEEACVYKGIEGQTAKGL